MAGPRCSDTGQPKPILRVGRYNDDVAARPAMTAEELIEHMQHAGPPTADDVPMTFDGRRLDSPEAIKAWLADLASRRAVAGSDVGA